LPGYFGWNLARTQCLAGLIIALIKVRTVNFAQLAITLPDGALKDSKHKRIKRIQRLFRTFPLDFSIVARFIVSQLPDGQYLLTIGRHPRTLRSRRRHHARNANQAGASPVHNRTDAVSLAPWSITPTSA